MTPPKINLSLKIVIIISFIILVIIGAYVIYKMKQPKKVEVKEEVMLRPISVLVLNGCGFNGLARSVSNSFDRDIIEVIDIGNTPHSIYNKSLIVVKKQDEDNLRRLQEYTGIKRFVYATNDHSSADFIIILGYDYEKYFK